MPDLHHPISDDQLQAYFDGALEPATEGIIQAHLETCPACRKKLAKLESLKAQLDNLPDLELSRDLSSLVVSRLAEEQSLSPAVTWPLVIEVLAAGTLIGLLIPALQAAGWLPQLLNARLELQAALNIYLTQLASSWLVWWAGLKLQANQLFRSFLSLASLNPSMISPWVLIAVTGGMGVLINFLLLGRIPLPGQDQNHN